MMLLSLMSLESVLQNGVKHYITCAPPPPPFCETQKISVLQENKKQQIFITLYSLLPMNCLSCQNDTIVIILTSQIVHLQ
jgi:hypothetical protein